MAERLTGQVARGGEGGEPAQRLEDFIAALFDNLFERPEETQLLMRELLDNKSRAGHAHTWHMKGFLDALTALARQAPGGKALSDTEALTRLYLIIGAATYFAVSEPTLRQMYEDVAFEGLRAQAREDVRRMTRDAFG